VKRGQQVRKQASAASGRQTQRAPPIQEKGRGKQAPTVNLEKGQVKKRQPRKQAPATKPVQGQPKGRRQVGKTADSSKQIQAPPAQEPLDWVDGPGGEDSIVEVQAPMLREDEPTPSEPATAESPLPVPTPPTEDPDSDSELQFVAAFYPGGAFEYGRGFSPHETRVVDYYSQLPLPTDGPVMAAPTAVTTEKRGEGANGKRAGKKAAPARRDARG
jgi:hypothetical protein